MHVRKREDSSTLVASCSGSAAPPRASSSTCSAQLHLHTKKWENKEMRNDGQCAAVDTSNSSVQIFVFSLESIFLEGLSREVVMYTKGNRTKKESGGGA